MQDLGGGGVEQQQILTQSSVELDGLAGTRGGGAGLHTDR